MKLSFSQKLMLLRKEKKVSQRQLADFLDIGASNIARYENGRLPTADILIKLSDFFGVSIDYLLKDDFQQDQDASPLLQQLNSLSKHDKSVVLDLIYGVMDSYLKNRGGN